MADDAPEVPPPVHPSTSEKNLDTRIATARDELKKKFLVVYETYVKGGTGIGMYNILNHDVQDQLRDALRKIGKDGWIKKWLDEDPKGPRTENSNAEKMQKCFLKICAHNYENFSAHYRAQGLFTADWIRIFTALTTYLKVLTEKISSTPMGSYLKWIFTGKGQQVSVEHLLMQLKNINETDEGDLPMNHL